MWPVHSQISNVNFEQHDLNCTICATGPTYETVIYFDCGRAILITSWIKKVVRSRSRPISPACCSDGSLVGATITNVWTTSFNKPPLQNCNYFFATSLTAWHLTDPNHWPPDKHLSDLTDHLTDTDWPHSCEQIIWTTVVNRLNEK